MEISSKAKSAQYRQLDDTKITNILALKMHTRVSKIQTIFKYETSLYVYFRVLYPNFLPPVGLK